jgi:SAM-dependent methyltransferase
MQNAKSVSDHYLSKSGRQYYYRYTPRLELGRIVQTEYFMPYADKNKIILDFGCSDGLFLRHLPAKERIGVEVNHTASEKCKELSEKEGIAVELHTSLKTIQANRVDVAISNHALEHVLNPYETLLEMYRCLKPKGRFIVVLPFDDWRSKGHSRWKGGGHDNHLYTWTPLNLGNLVSEAGFSVIKTELHTRAWSSKIFWIYRLFGKRSFNKACWLLSLFKNRREVLCVSEKP